MITNWDEALRQSLLHLLPAAQANALYDDFLSSIATPYRDSTLPAEAATDLVQLGTLAPDREFVARVSGDAAQGIHVKIFHRGGRLDLSGIMPLLESFGLHVQAEKAWSFTRQDGSRWLHDFQASLPVGVVLNPDGISRLEQAMLASWSGQADIDGGNALVTAAGFSWREVIIFRALAASCHQFGFACPDDIQWRTWLRYPAICQSLLALFYARFDPALDEGARQERCQQINQQLHDQLESVERLDEDTVLRRLQAMIMAMVRTNYFQGDKPWLAFKFATRELKDIEPPVPLYEIAVFSPRMQGVHLRMGPVARGGIRWSERNDDFRTEILGLMKAQQVKNALIVPVGAKGGFVLRKPPQQGVTQAQAGLEAYRTLIRGMLDITDNLDGGRSVHPDRVVCHDGFDPYLVVAADKGTASFSDTANGLAADYGFWLGDAFASGGSHGYDHKALGITARGAFVSLRRLARELGFDPDHDQFTVLGIGSMAGDVSGNGLLLSKKIRLRAAFNHSHIFIDPEPDAERSFVERQRLFALPHSNWTDYDAGLISAGGGVFSRQEKHISLSPAVQQWLGTSVASLSPNELIKALLKAPVDVIWNGGIGTYIKAATEHHSDAEDKANDAIRVNGNELRARMVVEGGNLGMTQRGRIEYALAGGRCHTDFIDNSAGVDCSDHEVNIKILLEQEMRAGRLNLEQRDALLQAWQTEVADAVLAHNREQTDALALASAEATVRHNEYGELCLWLEQVAGLDRELEALPGTEALAERLRRHQPLTRPELAVLMCYLKNHLKETLAINELLAMPTLREELLSAFPAGIQAQYRQQLLEHPLAPALAATAWASSLCDGLGLTALPQLMRVRGATLPGVLQAYAIARTLLDLPGLHSRLRELATTLPDTVTLPVRLALQRNARQLTGCLLHVADTPLETMLERFTPLHTLTPDIGLVLGPARRECWSKRQAELTRQGVPDELAARLATADLALPLLSVMQAADRAGKGLVETARVYFGLEALLDLQDVLDHVQDLPVANDWEADARAQYRFSLLQGLATLTVKALAAPVQPEEITATWLESRLQQSGALTSWQTLRHRLGAQELASYAPYVVLLAELANLVEAVGSLA